MSDYTPTGNPLAQTRSISSSIRNEFLAIATAVNSKSDNAGDTYTGTHDFTGATINVETLPYGTTGTYAVSWDAMNAATFAAANLPAQTGNSGKSLVTDGTTPSWGYTHVATINATITANTTLTGGYIYAPVQMATLGQSVTLPSAVALQLGGPQYIIDNTLGTYPAGIRNNAGTLLWAVAPGGEAFVSLKDNSTAAGVWSITGSGLEPGLVTIDSTQSTGFTTAVLAPFVALDANTSIHFMVGTIGGFSAIVVDNTGKVLAGPTTVTAAASEVPVAAFKISATSAIVFYGFGTNSRAVVLTVGGTSPSLTLTVGTAASETATGAWGTGTAGGAIPTIAQLSPTLYVSSYFITTPAAGAIPISISGTTVTIGTAATIAGATNQGVMAFALSATTALVVYTSGTAPFSMSAAVATVSGTTATFGTPASLTQTSGSNNLVPSAVLLSSTKLIIAFAGNTSAAVYAGAATISGTSVSWGTALQVNSTSINAADVTFTGAGASVYNPHLWAITSNTAGFWYPDPSGNSRVVVLSESSGTLTQGTKLYGSFSAALSGATGFGTMGVQNTTDFITITQTGAANGWRNTLVPHKISGTTITYGASQPLRELSPIPVATSFPTVRLSQGDYLVMGANSQAMLVFRSNGDVMNRRGAISIPNLSGPSAYPLQAVASNRLVLIGPTVGSTSSTAQQLRLLNIEVAA